MKLKIAAGLFGAVFGAWLCWVGFTDYDVITEALLLRDFYLWQIFVTGVVVGGAGLWILKRFRARTLFEGVPVAWDSPALTPAHFAGAAIFGAGWAISGACPGPAIAQIGQGHLSGGFIVIGILAGVVLNDLWLESRERADAKRPLGPEAASGA